MPVWPGWRKQAWRAWRRGSGFEGRTILPLSRLAQIGQALPQQTVRRIGWIPPGTIGSEDRRLWRDHIGYNTFREFLFCS